MFDEFCHTKFTFVLLTQKTLLTIKTKKVLTLLRKLFFINLNKCLLYFTDHTSGQTDKLKKVNGNAH